MEKVKAIVAEVNHLIHQKDLNQVRVPILLQVATEVPGAVMKEVATVAMVLQEKAKKAY